MFGELTAEETICHLIVTSKLENCIFNIPNPFDENNDIALYVNLNTNTKNKVEFINNSPYITSTVKLDARVLSANKETDFFEADNLELIESYANSFIKDKIETYLYKTAKNYKADIDSFGKYAVHHFMTWNNWSDYNWLENYTNSFFDVDVNVNVISSFLIS